MQLMVEAATQAVFILIDEDYDEIIVRNLLMDENLKTKSYDDEMDVGI